MFKNLYNSKNQWRKNRIQFLSQTAKVKENFFQNSRSNNEMSQYYFPWNYKAKQLGKVIRKSELNDSSENLEEMRVSTSNLESYLENDN